MGCLGKEVDRLKGRYSKPAFAENPRVSGQGRWVAGDVTEGRGSHSDQGTQHRLVDSRAWGVRDHEIESPVFRHQDGDHLLNTARPEGAVSPRSVLFGVSAGVGNRLLDLLDSNHPVGPFCQVKADASCPAVEVEDSGAGQITRQRNDLLVQNRCLTGVGLEEGR